MSILVIGNKNYSSWSLRPWLVLKHLGIDFDERQLQLDTEQFQSQLALFSNAGRVPVWIVDQLKIWDSLAICEYLAEAHPKLWPDEVDERALARAMVCEMHSSFNALRNELPMNCRAEQRQIDISSEARRDIDRIEQIWQQCYTHRSSPSHSEGPWLFGRFGIIDAFFAPVAIRFHGYRLNLTPATKAYVQLQLDNPLLQQWITAGQAEAEIIAHEERGRADDC